MPTFRGYIYGEEDMPMEETEMKEKITFGAFQSHIKSD